MSSLMLLLRTCLSTRTKAVVSYMLTVRIQSDVSLPPVRGWVRSTSALMSLLIIMRVCINSAETCTNTSIIVWSKQIFNSYSPSATRGMASILSEIMMYVSIIGLQLWLVVEMVYCYRKIAAAGEEALRESEWVGCLYVFIFLTLPFSLLFLNNKHLLPH